MSDLLQIIQGDALEKLSEMPCESVQCCVTSPPYWGLRDYSTNGQLGLEKTPEEYVAKMVEIFREVRRVLRKDGSLWLNLGSSYAGGGQGGGGSMVNDVAAWRPGCGRADGVVDAEARRNRNGCGVVDGFKPKDLVPIPWMVAMALQQPYYTGKIKRVEDRIWLAAMIDGEGCMYIHKRKAGQNNGQGYQRQNDSYSAGMEVANTSEAIAQRCLDITGIGSIFRHEKDRRLPLFRWMVRSNECRNVVREVYPHLVSKQQQARILCGCPSSGKEAEAAHAALIALHNGIETPVDFKAPASMFEEGWYLRSDVIWSKKNPMPESVTDRPTKSHEYLFLLTKTSTYYYDAEAIKERVEAKWEDSHYKYYRENGTRNAHTNPDRLDQGSAGEYVIGSKNRFGITRNKRSVWTIPTASFNGAHFATFPPDLIKPCIMAGTSAKGCCGRCCAPWERVVERDREHHHETYRDGKTMDGPYAKQAEIRNGILPTSKTLGWQPTCKCWNGNAGVFYTIPCVVLDPFAGSGTTGAVALELGRKAVLIELNPVYVELMEQRCSVTMGLALA